MFVCRLVPPLVSMKKQGLVDYRAINVAAFAVCELWNAALKNSIRFS